MNFPYLYNPWTDDAERREPTRRLMSLANDFGYKFDTPGNAEEQLKSVESRNSVKMLSLMSEISATVDKLNSINRSINRLVMDKETHDITSLTNIESRLNKLSALSKHLGEVVDGKSLITNQLQQPYSDENLLIDASLQKHVVEFFTMVSPLLSDLSNLLDTISWTTSNAKQLPNKTDQVMVTMSMSLNEVSQRVERLEKLRNTIDSFSNSST